MKRPGLRQGEIFVSTDSFPLRQFKRCQRFVKKTENGARSKKTAWSLRAYAQPRDLRSEAAVIIHLQRFKADNLPPSEPSTAAAANHRPQAIVAGSPVLGIPARSEDTLEESLLLLADKVPIEVSAERGGGGMKLPARRGNAALA